MPLILLLLVLQSGGAPAQSPGAYALALKAAAYVKDYERSLSLVVAEEDYTQDTGAATRRLRSDLLIILDDEFGWIEFRDVFAVNNRDVRDRNGRLAALFMKPAANRLEQALRITEEGARYNLMPRGGRLERTLNTPLTTLRYLRSPDRCSFEMLPQAPPGPAGYQPLAFFERARPHIVRTPDDAPAQGIAWIDPESGRIGQTQLTIRSGKGGATITVTYAEDAKLGMLLPATMEEEYDIGRGAKVLGHARYANFRRFRVETSTDIK